MKKKRNNCTKKADSTRKDAQNVPKERKRKPDESVDTLRMESEDSSTGQNQTKTQKRVIIEDQAMIENGQTAPKSIEQKLRRQEQVQKAVKKYRKLESPQKIEERLRINQQSMAESRNHESPTEQD